MNFRSFVDMNRTIMQNLHKVPIDTDLIVGIPRSGLMIANILAMHLNLPIADTSKILEGKVLSLDGSIDGHQVEFDGFKKIFVIDDSVNSGRSIKQVKDKLRSFYPDKEFVFTAVYADTKSKNKVDIYFEVCQSPRIFEWNIMNHYNISNFCMEIDGVLCESIKLEQYETQEKFINFIENASSMLKTSTIIGCLVTRIPVEYKKYTEKWLLSKGIKYKELYMYDNKRIMGNNKSTNIYKAKIFKDHIYSKLFIESKYDNACEIAFLSGKTVYAVDKGEIIKPKWVAAKKRIVIDLFKKAFYKIKTYIK